MQKMKEQEQEGTKAPSQHAQYASMELEPLSLDGLDSPGYLFICTCGDPTCGIGPFTQKISADGPMAARTSDYVKQLNRDRGHDCGCGNWGPFERDFDGPEGAIKNLPEDAVIDRIKEGW